MNTNVKDLVVMTKEALIEAINSLLGKDGTRIAQKITESADTPEGLRAAVHQCEKITRLTFEQGKFEQLKDICTGLLTDLEDAAAGLADGSDNIQQERKIRMVKAKMITIASKVLGNGADGLKITTKLRNAPESVEGLKGSLEECEKLASLTIDPKKVQAMKYNCDKVLEEIA